MMKSNHITGHLDDLWHFNSGEQEILLFPDGHISGTFAVIVEQARAFGNKVSILRGENDVIYCALWRDVIYHKRSDGLLLELEKVELHDRPDKLYDILTDYDQNFHAVERTDSHTVPEQRMYRLTKPYKKIVADHRKEILHYNLSTYTDKDEVRMSDIFMHGGFIKEVNIHQCPECGHVMGENYEHCGSAEDGTCNYCGYEEPDE